MALTQGCLDILFQVHKICLLPIKFTSESSSIRVIPNPQFGGSSKLTWRACKLFIFCTTIFSVARLNWLITKWKHIQDFEQPCYYLLLLSLVVIGWEAFRVGENHLEEAIFLITQRFKTVPHICGKMSP